MSGPTFFCTAETAVFASIRSDKTMRGLGKYFSSLRTLCTGLDSASQLPTADGRFESGGQRNWTNALSPSVAIGQINWSTASSAFAAWQHLTGTHAIQPPHPPPPSDALALASRQRRRWMLAAVSCRGMGEVLWGVRVCCTNLLSSSCCCHCPVGFSSRERGNLDYSSPSGLTHMLIDSCKLRIISTNHHTSSSSSSSLLMLGRLAVGLCVLT